MKTAKQIACEAICKGMNYSCGYNRIERTHNGWLMEACFSGECAGQAQAWEAIKNMETEIKCPDGLTPDGPICPACGGRRGASGIDGGTWVHF